VAAVRSGAAGERVPVSSDGFGRLSAEAQTMAFELRALAGVHGELEAERAQVLQLEQAAQAMAGAIEVLAGAVEERTPHLAGHQRRVSALAGAIAEDLGLPASEVQGVRLGALVHDVGNVAVNAAVLDKPAVLTATELAAMRAHAKAGYDLLKELPSPWPIALMALQHHERLDGSGYPMGLKGEDIVLAARILAVADVVEAMVSERPHRPALSLEQALTELEHQRNTLYDGRVVDVCVALLRSGRFSL
jgi:HD-GYP domain-containing protein (c-di-GMP phosphodiesterase class II)